MRLRAWLFATGASRLASLPTPLKRETANEFQASLEEAAQWQRGHARKRAWFSTARTSRIGSQGTVNSTWTWLNAAIFHSFAARYCKAVVLGDYDNSVFGSGVPSGIALKVEADSLALRNDDMLVDNAIPDACPALTVTS